MSETRTLWQRCEALGQLEDFRDKHLDMHFEDERWVIHHDGHPIAFIYEDCMQGSPWLADAILCHIERIRFGTTTDIRTFCQQDLNRAGIANVCRPIPDQLPDVTYVVEAPKPTEPTQEQLKAIWDHVTHLTGEQAESYGFKYAVIADPVRAQFVLDIRAVGMECEDWKVTIVHRLDRFGLSSPFDFKGTCEIIGCPTIALADAATESPLQFVSIPVTEWQQLREAHKTIQSIMFPEIKDVEFES